MIAYKNQTDGKYFGELYGLCTILKEPHKHCGTYGCPFYKPHNCADWVRKDGTYVVELIPPEEVDYVQV